MALEPALFGVVGALASIVLPRVLEAPSGWTFKVPGWFGFFRLGYIRAAGATLFSIALPTAIERSFSNESHRWVTYVVLYGLAAIGLLIVVITTIAIDRRDLRDRAHGSVPPPALLVVEDEVSLAYEEAFEMARILRATASGPSPEAAVVKVALPDWEEKTATFLGSVLGSPYRAAFRGSREGGPLDDLKGEAAFLSQLSLKLTPEMIRVDAASAEAAAARRRENETAAFFVYTQTWVTTGLGAVA